MTTTSVSKARRTQAFLRSVSIRQIAWGHGALVSAGYGSEWPRAPGLCCGLLTGLHLAALPSWKRVRTAHSPRIGFTQAQSPQKRRQATSQPGQATKAARHASPPGRPGRADNAGTEPPRSEAQPSARKPPEGQLPRPEATTPKHSGAHHGPSARSFLRLRAITAPSERASPLSSLLAGPWPPSPAP
jgi:hypothetical protein